MLRLSSESQTDNFNPHSREGSDSIAIKLIAFPSISIHTPAKGVTEHGCNGQLSEIYFNPHSREGSDFVKGASERQWSDISIHTPAKGVTHSLQVPAWTSLISIHTPAKGVTAITSTMVQKINISIHTPAKGVTFLKNFRRSLETNFNPHSREGSDPIFPVNPIPACVFQSTLPRRE